MAGWGCWAGWAGCAGWAGWHGWAGWPGWAAGLVGLTGLARLAGLAGLAGCRKSHSGRVSQNRRFQLGIKAVAIGKSIFVTSGTSGGAGEGGVWVGLGWTTPRVDFQVGGYLC